MFFSKELTAGNRKISENDPCYVIAEAGVNHNGDMNLGKKLIEAAKEAGADAVKFQTFKAENLNTKSAPKSTYHIKTTGNEESWYDLLKSQELNRDHHIELLDHCEKVGIRFLSTPYDEGSANLLEEFNLPFYKIASTDLNNTPFIQFLSKKNIPLILSTAMSTLEEVKESVDVVKQCNQKDLVLLHCTANYPADLENTNLNAMLTLKNEFGCVVGYSDHCPSIINPIAAVALGAVVYEKHFTLDHDLPGPDHKASLLPGDLKIMIENIRDTEIALGTGIKAPMESEKENRQKLRKSVVANTDIPKGAVIQESMLSIKRPGSGVSPNQFWNILGKQSTAEIPKDTLLSMNMFE